jgi:hypothetical protein
MAVIDRCSAKAVEAVKYEYTDMESTEQWLGDIVRCMLLLMIVAVMLEVMIYLVRYRLCVEVAVPESAPPVRIALHIPAGFQVL